jgi:hypothetical protein
MGLAKEGKQIGIITKTLGESENAIYLKLDRLGVQVEEESEKNQFPSSPTAVA